MPPRFHCTPPEIVASLTARLALRGPRAAAAGRLLARRADRLRSVEHVIPLLLTDRARDLPLALATAICPSPAWLRARYGVASLPRAWLAHAGRMTAVLRRVTAADSRWNRET